GALRRARVPAVRLHRRVQPHAERGDKDARGGTGRAGRGLVRRRLPRYRPGPHAGDARELAHGAGLEVHTQERLLPPRRDGDGVPRRLAGDVEPAQRAAAMRGVVALGLAAAVVLAAGCRESRTGPVTLRMWAMGREGEVVGELVRDFEREHPDIHVQVQQIPWTAAHEKLLTAHVGGSLPDVGQLGNSWISEFGTLEALAPLDPCLAK